MECSIRKWNVTEAVKNGKVLDMRMYSLIRETVKG